MSLTFAPFGLKPVRTLNGGEIRIGRYILSSSSARVFRGDVVKLNSLGLATRAAATDLGTVILGVAAQDSGVIAGQNTSFPVYDDPETVFQAQASATITQALIGGSVKIVATAGDTATGKSKETVAITNTASASYFVRVIRLAPDLNNDVNTAPLLEVILAGDPTKVSRK